MQERSDFGIRNSEYTVSLLRILVLLFTFLANCISKALVISFKYSFACILIMFSNDIYLSSYLGCNLSLHPGDNCYNAYPCVICICYSRLQVVKHDIFLTKQIYLSTQREAGLFLLWQCAVLLFDSLVRLCRII